MSDSDEEVIIEDEDEYINDNEYQNYGMSQQYQEFDTSIRIFDSYLPFYDVGHIDWTVSFHIPHTVLPLSLQAVCGFHKNPILLDFKFTLNYSWKKSPVELNFEHPDFHKNYVGNSLVQVVVHDFFKESYAPKKDYKSRAYIFKPSGHADRSKTSNLVSEGFDENCAENALVLCKNDIKTARDFLLTGKLPVQATRIPVTYQECPLVYLVLEIVEAFLDLNDHCCICRQPLGVSGIKPSICQNRLCACSFNEIGVGTSVAQEIRRDPIAADLLVSMYSAAYNTNYFNPAPPSDIHNFSNILFERLPNMQSLASRAQTDQELTNIIGKDVLSLLRWILLSNKSHLITLPDKFKLVNASGYQFLSLISSPGAELDFEKYKSKYGSCFLWHGSGGDRWYSITRNGLKNMSNVQGGVIHGAAYGPGIYLAHDSSTSFGYVQHLSNKYRNSCLGRSFPLISLCEIANVPELKSFGNIRTLIKEEACVVRFLFAGGNFQWDTIRNPPSKVPSLQDILETQGGSVKS